MAAIPSPTTVASIRQLVSHLSRICRLVGLSSTRSTRRSRSWVGGQGGISPQDVADSRTAP